MLFQMSCFIPAIIGRYLFTCKENRVGQLYDILNSEKGFPDSSAGKESASNAGDPGLIPGSGRSPGEGIGNPLQYSGLENHMNYTVHGILQARILEWVAFPFSRGSSQPRN